MALSTFAGTPHTPGQIHQPRTDREAEIAGLDALDIPIANAKGRVARAWEGLWPKLTALALFFGAWQIVAWLELKPSYVLPGPGPVLHQFWEDLIDGVLIHATATTMQRALIGYAISVVVGVLFGLAVARNQILRAAFGSMITGLQTMPTIAWLPLAVLLFKLTEGAITFVVILGAAPAIANGVISGVDHIPPVLLRAGRVLGAKGIAAYRHIIVPAALPGLVAGLKQGWAFAWRSLMAGELLNIIPGAKSLGQQLDVNRQFADYAGVLAVMVVIFLIGVVIDAVFFGNVERWIRRRYGLVDEATNA